MTENIELYTREGEPSGVIIDRDDKVKSGLRFPVACVWVENEEGRLLTTLRSPEKEFSPNKWENPGGGIKAGETPLEGAVRELFEETGIKCEEGELELIDMVRRGRSFFVFTFGVKITSPKVRLLEHETVDYRWVTPAELISMCEAGQVADHIAMRIIKYKEKLIKWCEK